MEGVDKSPLYPPGLYTYAQHACILSYLSGLSDGSQLQVFRVAPAVQLSVCRHGQAAVSVRADLLHLHARQLPANRCWSGAHVVMSKTWNVREKQNQLNFRGQREP